jgi:hypothetical protein
MTRIQHRLQRLEKALVAQRRTVRFDDLRVESTGAPWDRGLYGQQAGSVVKVIARSLHIDVLRKYESDLRLQPEPSAAAAPALRTRPLVWHIKPTG